MNLLDSLLIVRFMLSSIVDYVILYPKVLRYFLFKKIHIDFIGTKNE